MNPHLKKLPFNTVEDELIIAVPFRNQFIETISFSDEDLKIIKIDRSDVGYIRDLGDMLLRIAYHESIHTGQLLDYLRSAKVTIPDIWD